ncbi:hydroxylysine kinase isoform X2 [Patagioenas fasciata]|uniref:hydroxylysine kinase isoform X2 n=1 Tax=Patagioenas fasciata TaxID=372321 RepID=UPI003A999D1C
MSSGNGCQPQTLTKPALGETEAAELVDRVFGLKVSWIGPLPSYDDQNFHVRVSRDGGADEYVLKITNSEDSREPDLIEAQTRAMMFLSAEGFPSASPRLTKDGTIMSLESASGCGNKKYMVRLLTYLPGTPVAKIATNAQIFYEIGKLAASLDKALTEKFHHPSTKSLHRAQFIWNLANVPLLDQYLYALGQNKYREVVEQVIEQFKGKVIPKLSNFRASSRVQGVRHPGFQRHELRLLRVRSGDSHHVHDDREPGSPGGRRARPGRVRERPAPQRGGESGPVPAGERALRAVPRHRRAHGPAVPREPGVPHGHGQDGLETPNEDV